MACRECRKNFGHTSDCRRGRNQSTVDRHGSDSSGDVAAMVQPVFYGGDSSSGCSPTDGGSSGGAVDCGSSF